LTQREPKAVSLLEERCLCGNLLAKVSRNGVEILCRRCKRIHRIPWQEERREDSAELRTRMAANR
jgi:phage FluMu protein Com